MAALLLTICSLMDQSRIISLISGSPGEQANGAITRARRLI
jgi:hypothetical protein